MSEIILPKSNIMLSMCSAVKSITDPLRKFGIIGFSYTRVYDDGTFIDASDHVDAMELFYYGSNLYKYYTPDIVPEMLKGEFFLCSALGDNIALNTLRETFSIDHIFVLTKRRLGYFEVFNFMGDTNNPSIVNFYINNLQILEAFASYFRKSAADIICKYEVDKVFRSKDFFLQHEGQLQDNIINTHRETFIPSAHDNSFELKKIPYLTRREKECLTWCVKGKSSTETAIIMNISRRTVEVFLSKIKNKLDCYKQTELVKKAIKFKICEIDD